MMTAPDMGEWKKELGELLGIAAGILGQEIVAEAPATSKRPLVLVAGSLKAGKSSLINDLLGKRLISDGQAVTDTRIYGRVVHGTDGDAWIVDRGGKREAVELAYAQVLLSKAAGEDPELVGLDRVELATTHDLLRHMDIEDSPGTEDPASGGRFVRTDVEDRALRAAMVLYLVPAMPGFTSPDGEFMRRVIKNRTPFCVVFTRCDMLDEVGPGDSPAACAIKSMCKWALVVSQDQIRFISSYWHRKGEAEKGGVVALREMLASLHGRLHAYQAAATCRLFAGTVASARVAISDRMAAREDATEGVTTQNEMRALQTVTGHLRRLQGISDECMNALNAAHGQALQSIKGACLHRKDVDAMYKTIIGPAWQARVADAVTSFNDRMKDLAAGIACRYELVTPVSAPAVTISGPSDIGSGLKLPGPARIAKEIYDEIAFHVSVSRTISAVDAAISGLDQVMMNRVRSCADAVEEQLRAGSEEKLAGAALEELHSIQRLRQICRQMTTLESKAQVAADELVR